jgi:hypothetical protein
MPESENIATLQRFVEEVINQGRLDAADELVEENFVELDPLPGQRQGREGLKEVIAMMRAAFPDIHWTAEEPWLPATRSSRASHGQARIAAISSASQQPAGKSLFQELSSTGYMLERWRTVVS